MEMKCNPTLSQKLYNAALLQRMMTEIKQAQRFKCEVMRKRVIEIDRIWYMHKPFPTWHNSRVL